MPRGHKNVTNPFPEGSAEAIEFADATAPHQENFPALPVATERNITVTVSLEAIAAAKSLGTLSGMPYRVVLGQAAAQGVEALAMKVREALGEQQAMPF